MSLRTHETRINRWKAWRQTMEGVVALKEAYEDDAMWMKWLDRLEKELLEHMKRELGMSLGHYSAPEFMER